MYKNLNLLAHVLTSIVKSLRSHPLAGIFQYPVKPNEEGIPDYLQIIKKPMDLSTIEANIKQRVYFQYMDFHEDVMLVFN